MKNKSKLYSTKKAKQLSGKFSRNSPFKLVESVQLRPSTVEGSNAHPYAGIPLNRFKRNGGFDPVKRSKGGHNV